MTTVQKDEILEQRGEDLYDGNGDKIGSIEEIYLDAETSEPEWALVKTGMFGTKSTFVPLHDLSREGDALRVPYDKDQVKDAPKPDPDGELSKDEEAQLYRHYGLEYSELGSASGLPQGGTGTRGTAGAGAGAGAGTGGTPDRAGAGTSSGTATNGGGDGADDAMTRSEEELHAGTTRKETGRVRLRKYVESEDVQETVAVGREEARVEREPITDDSVDTAMSGPEISEGEHEVVLHEEEVVAEKRAVPKERVRLDKDTVTDERQVSDTVRKERIEIDESDRDDR
jgi:uncharacterized protein (TIGR02271 family)